MEIPSDNCQFNEKPDMKAREITAAGKEALLCGRFQMVRVNYANPGDLPPAHSSLYNRFDTTALCCSIS